MFDTTLSAAKNVDHVTDFTVGADMIELAHAIFTGAPIGALSSDAFAMGAAASDADDRIIYNAATGALFYDSNGSAAGGRVQFATLSTGLGPLSASDFKIV